MNNDNNRRSGPGRGNSFRQWNDRPREMHNATCSACKKECQVPFKPKEDRPVYCKDCFAKQRDN